MMKKPLITAHTGCNNTPNNTIESVLTGFKYGADLNEVDVRITGDDIIVLWHDDFIETTDGKQIVIKSKTYKELCDLKNEHQLVFPQSQKTITKLEDVFAAVKDKDIYLNLDIKDDDCIEPVTKLVKKWDMINRIIFSGCEYERAENLKKQNPEFQVLLNADETLLKREDLSYIDKARFLCDKAISLSCCGLNIEYNYCLPELIKYADMRHLPVSVWTLSTDKLFQKYIEMGVFSITTYEVKELVRLRNNIITAA